jgi:hypothetical protein
MPAKVVKRKVSLATRKKMSLAQKRRHRSPIKDQAKLRALIRKIKASQK